MFYESRCEVLFIIDVHHFTNPSSEQNIMSYPLLFGQLNFLAVPYVICGIRNLSNKVAGNGFLV